MTCLLESSSKKLPTDANVCLGRAEGNRVTIAPAFPSSLAAPFKEKWSICSCIHFCGNAGDSVADIVSEAFCKAEKAAYISPNMSIMKIIVKHLQRRRYHFGNSLTSAEIENLSKLRANNVYAICRRYKYNPLKLKATKPSAPRSWRGVPEVSIASVMTCFKRQYYHRRNVIVWLSGKSTLTRVSNRYASGHYTYEPSAVQPHQPCKDKLHRISIRKKSIK